MAITNYPEYPAEQIEWLRQYYPTHSMKDTHKAFNEHFGLELSESSIKHRVQKFGIKTANDGKFKKNRQPWNKGIVFDELPNNRYKGVWGAKKGVECHTILPVGTESKWKYCTLIKIAMPDVWEVKARYVYRTYHKCELTKEDIILHLDNDKYNDDPKNLIKVTKGMIAILNKKGLIFEDGELTRCAVTQQQLLQKIKELEEGKE